MKHKEGTLRLGYLRITRIATAISGYFLEKEISTPPMYFKHLSDFVLMFHSKSSVSLIKPRKYNCSLEREFEVKQTYKDGQKGCLNRLNGGIYC